MNIYKKLYDGICDRGKTRIELYENKEKALHRHHIVPTHVGGLDEEENFSYLTIREHIIAHYLLWKVYKNPNDLRAMHMLGAKLSRYQRQITGWFCRDNKIGFFGVPKEQRRLWRRKGALVQIQNGQGIHTTDKTKRSEWASMGGKIGAIHQIQNGQGIHTTDKTKRSEWASMGGKAHIGKRWMHFGNKKLRCPSQEVEIKLQEGWKMGYKNRD